MKINHATVYAMRLPLVEGFAHSLSERSHSDSVIVRVTAENGATGYGEGMPRSYVTGEEVESTVDFIHRGIWPSIRRIALPDSIDAARGLEQFGAIAEALDSAGSQHDVVASNSARCAVEMALFDLALKRSGVSLAALVPPVRNQIVYCGVLPTGTAELAERHARYAKLLGATHLKVKVGALDVTAERERLDVIRGVVGPDVALSIDANGAYTVADAIAVLRALTPVGIVGAEQPVPRGEPAELASVRRETTIPIIADESICTLDDARLLADAGACDAFSIRISKCGGVGPSLEIAHLAAERGIGIKIGCHVGETALLSAAGRHVAAHVPQVIAVEGSFGTMLLQEDISTEPVQFGHGGRASLLRRPGFGVEVHLPTVERHASRTVSLV
jgi:L-alanine-DL-glutamate epimerase-like enolase superfamily enzyme